MKEVTMRIKDDVEHTLTIHKSEFICYLHKCFSEEDARDYINKIRKLHREATHCCTAFVIGENNEIQRSNDDGEPSGTAGMPILDALRKSGITNCCACVVRYYGGIKLGAGGLIRAYSSSVSEALQAAKKVDVRMMSIYQCSFSYGLINQFDFFLKDLGTILDKTYELDVCYTILTDNPTFSDECIEYTNGKVSPHFIEEKLVEVDLPTINSN